MKQALKPLDRQVMLITGASSGIGLITARLAARHGASVMLVARNEPALARIVEDIKAAGGSADYAVADVGDRQALAAAAEKAVARFGRIDTWVNNAGVAIYARLMETPDAEHERLFRTNYFGVVNGARIAVDHLRRSGGALITISSIAADMPSPILGAYTASKHAAKAFIESLRIELEAQGLPIAVVLLKPAGMATPIGMHAANHMEGEAKVPPPAYDARLVARAILDSATGRTHGDITIGGIGRAQVLFASHFPKLFDRLAPWIIPLLSSPRIARTPSDALFTPAPDGCETSPHEKGLRHSSYNSLIRHIRPASALLLGAVAAAVWAALRKGAPSRAEDPKATHQRSDVYDGR